MFRVRISRVILKDGGADVRILPRPRPRSAVEVHLREWTNIVLANEKPAIAYAAVAFWINPEAPGRPDYHVAYITDDDRLPTQLLTEIAGIYIRNDMIASISHNHTMTAIGWTLAPWDPDPDNQA